MSISDEAVEAAAGVLVYHQRQDSTACMCGWSELGRSHAAHQAQLALEAAATHMLAAEYQRGYDEGYDEGHRAGQYSAEIDD